MVEKLHYSAFVTDAEALSRYDDYQSRYRDSIRESDKILIELICEAAAGRPARLLDIGCSTGNLLRHIQRLVPGLDLHGGDLAASSIDTCRADPELSDMTFGRVDMLDFSDINPLDIVVANAVTYLFSWPDYEKALRNVFSTLNSGGTYIAFDWLHPFAVQDLTVIETSEWHPDGLKMHLRPMPKVEALLREIGFSEVAFHPFELPIDLPFPGYEADVGTYTRKDEEGRRLAFRGILYQPWCHLVARKA